MNKKMIARFAVVCRQVMAGVPLVLAGMGGAAVAWGETPGTGIQAVESLQAEPVAPEWQTVSVTQLNERLIQAAKAIAARDYAGACSELTLVPQELDERQPQLTFNAWYLLGQCHAGLGMYDEARDYFQKVVEADPQAPRPRLDLAMVEQYLGDFEAADRQFAALDDIEGLDASVRDRIDEIYDQRPNRLQYGAEVYVGMINDSNINYGPDSDVLHLYDRDLTLNRESRPLASSGQQMGLTLSIDKLMDRRSRLSGRLGLAKTAYSESADFDNSILDLLVAWRQKAWGGEYMIQPRYAAVTLGSENLFNVAGIESGYAWLQTDDLRLTAMLGYRTYSYSVDSDRNTSELRPWVQANYRYTGQLILNARAGYSFATAANDAYSYSDLELALGADYVITPALLLTLNYETSSTGYAGKLDGYGKARSDQRSKVSAGISYNFQNFGDQLKRFSLDLGLRNYSNSSNIDLYENQRTQSYLTIRAAM
jgi:tetratricopeptide (TPR) repeat protein